MRFAVERGYQIDPALLHKATYSKNPAIRKKAREAIFKSVTQQLDERARKGTAYEQRVESRSGAVAVW